MSSPKSEFADNCVSQDPDPAICSVAGSSSTDQLDDKGALSPATHDAAPSKAVETTGQRVAHDLNDAKKKRTVDICAPDDVDFASLMLSERVLSGLAQAGFARPSPIQLQAIPIGRCGMDLVVQAKSGTGKTCVFVVVALETVIVANPKPQVLILAPTREIADQICGAIKQIASHITGLKTGLFIGGTDVGTDKATLREPCHIVVGTPGRLCQLVQIGALSLNATRLFVLDEADKLMDPSFHTNVNWIFSNLPPSKQVLVLSATYPFALDQMLSKYMRSPTMIKMNESDVQLVGVKQYVTSVSKCTESNLVAKTRVLHDILSSISFSQCLIFCNFQSRAEDIASHFEERSWPTKFISASLSQAERSEVMSTLKSFQCRILVSTDLTARGIDAENVNLVINFDIPSDAETYFHRIGRAGRYGSYGAAITVLYGSNEHDQFYRMAASNNFHIKQLHDPCPDDLVNENEAWCSAQVPPDLQIYFDQFRASPLKPTTTSFNTEGGEPNLEGRVIAAAKELETICNLKDGDDGSGSGKPTVNGINEHDDAGDEDDDDGDFHDVAGEPVPEMGDKRRYSRKQLLSMWPASKRIPMFGSNNWPATKQRQAQTLQEEQKKRDAKRKPGAGGSKKKAGKNPIVEPDTPVDAVESQVLLDPRLSVDILRPIPNFYFHGLLKRDVTSSLVNVVGHKRHGSNSRTRTQQPDGQDTGECGSGGVPRGDVAPRYRKRFKPSAGDDDQNLEQNDDGALESNEQDGEQVVEAVKLKPPTEDVGYPFPEPGGGDESDLSRQTTFESALSSQMDSDSDTFNSARSTTGAAPEGIVFHFGATAAASVKSFEEHDGTPVAADEDGGPATPTFAGSETTHDASKDDTSVQNDATASESPRLSYTRNEMCRLNVGLPVPDRSLTQPSKPTNKASTTSNELNPVSAVSSIVENMENLITSANEEPNAASNRVPRACAYTSAEMMSLRGAVPPCHSARDAAAYLRTHTQLDAVTRQDLLRSGNSPRGSYVTRSGGPTRRHADEGFVSPFKEAESSTKPVYVSLQERAKKQQQQGGGQQQRNPAAYNARRIGLTAVDTEPPLTGGEGTSRMPLNRMDSGMELSVNKIMASVTGLRPTHIPDREPYSVLSTNEEDSVKTTDSGNKQTNNNSENAEVSEPSGSTDKTEMSKSSASSLIKDDVRATFTDQIYCRRKGQTATAAITIAQSDRHHSTAAATAVTSPPTTNIANPLFVGAIPGAIGIRGPTGMPVIYSPSSPPPALPGIQLPLRSTSPANIQRGIHNPLMHTVPPAPLNPVIPPPVIVQATGPQVSTTAAATPYERAQASLCSAEKMADEMQEYIEKALGESVNVAAKIDAGAVPTKSAKTDGDLQPKQQYSVVADAVKTQLKSNSNDDTALVSRIEKLESRCVDKSSSILQHQNVIEAPSKRGGRRTKNKQKPNKNNTAAPLITDVNAAENTTNGSRRDSEPSIQPEAVSTKGRKTSFDKENSAPCPTNAADNTDCSDETASTSLPSSTTLDETATRQRESSAGRKGVTVMVGRQRKISILNPDAAEFVASSPTIVTPVLLTYAQRAAAFSAQRPVVPPGRHRIQYSRDQLIHLSDQARVIAFPSASSSISPEVYSIIAASDRQKRLPPVLGHLSVVTTAQSTTATGSPLVGSSIAVSDIMAAAAAANSTDTGASQHSLKPSIPFPPHIAAQLGMPWLTTAPTSAAGANREQRSESPGGARGNTPDPAIITVGPVSPTSILKSAAQSPASVSKTATSAVEASDSAPPTVLQLLEKGASRAKNFASSAVPDAANESSHVDEPTTTKSPSKSNTKSYDRNTLLAINVMTRAASSSDIVPDKELRQHLSNKGIKPIVPHKATVDVVSPLQTPTKKGITGDALKNMFQKAKEATPATSGHDEVPPTAKPFSLATRKNSTELKVFAAVPSSVTTSIDRGAASVELDVAMTAASNAMQNAGTTTDPRNAWANKAVMMPEVGGARAVADVREGSEGASERRTGRKSGRSKETVHQAELDRFRHSVSPTGFWTAGPAEEVENGRRTYNRKQLLALRWLRESAALSPKGPATLLKTRLHAMAAEERVPCKPATNADKPIDISLFDPEPPGEENETDSAAQIPSLFVERHPDLLAAAEHHELRDPRLISVVARYNAAKLGPSEKTFEESRAEAILGNRVTAQPGFDEGVAAAHAFFVEEARRRITSYCRFLEYRCTLPATGPSSRRSKAASGETAALATTTRPATTNRCTNLSGDFNDAFPPLKATAHSEEITLPCGRKILNLPSVYGVAEAAGSSKVAVNQFALPKGPDYGNKPVHVSSLHDLVTGPQHAAKPSASHTQSFNPTEPISVYSLVEAESSPPTFHQKILDRQRGPCSTGPDGNARIRAARGSRNEVHVASGTDGNDRFSSPTQPTMSPDRADGSKASSKETTTQTPNNRRSTAAQCQRAAASTTGKATQTVTQSQKATSTKMTTTTTADATTGMAEVLVNARYRKQWPGHHSQESSRDIRSDEADENVEPLAAAAPSPSSAGSTRKRQPVNRQQAKEVATKMESYMEFMTQG